MRFILRWRGTQSKDVMGRCISMEHLPLLVIDNHPIAHRLKHCFELIGAQNRFAFSHQCSYTRNLTLIGEESDDDACTGKRQQLKHATPPVGAECSKRWDIPVIENQQAQEHGKDRWSNAPQQGHQHDGKQERNARK